MEINFVIERPRIAAPVVGVEIPNASEHGQPSSLIGKYKRNEIFFFVVNVNFAKLPWDGKLTL